jgi:hypothetical protein
MAGPGSPKVTLRQLWAFLPLISSSVNFFQQSQQLAMIDCSLSKEVPKKLLFVPLVRRRFVVLFSDRYKIIRLRTSSVSTFFPRTATCDFERRLTYTTYPVLCQRTGLEHSRWTPQGLVFRMGRTVNTSSLRSKNILGTVDLSASPPLELLVRRQETHVLDLYIHLSGFGCFHVCCETGDDSCSQSYHGCEQANFTKLYTRTHRRTVRVRVLVKQREHGILLADGDQDEQSVIKAFFFYVLEETTPSHQRRAPSPFPTVLLEAARLI